MMYLMLIAFMSFFSISYSESDCALATLRQCSETDNSNCCKPYSDPDLNMEIGIKAGDFILSKHLKPKHSGHCQKLSVTKVKNVMQAISSLDMYTKSLNQKDNELQMDIVIAMSRLLVDLQNTTCEWISDCFLIPPELSCDEYLTQFALIVSLKDPIFSLSCSGNYQWCDWWIEKAVCKEDELISMKNRYTYYYDNGPKYTCVSA